MYLTKWELFALLSAHGDSSVILPDGRLFVLSSIQREDGSGRSFNVAGTVKGESVTIHVRTRD